MYCTNICVCVCVCARARVHKFPLLSSSTSLLSPDFFGLVRPSSSLPPLLFPHLVSTQPPPCPDILLDTTGELGLEPPRVPPSHFVQRAWPSRLALPAERSTDPSSHCPRTNIAPAGRTAGFAATWRPFPAVGLGLSPLSCPVPSGLARFFGLERKRPLAGPFRGGVESAEIRGCRNCTDKSCGPCGRSGGRDQKERSFAEEERRTCERQKMPLSLSLFSFGWQLVYS